LIEPSPNQIHLIHPYSQTRPANQTYKPGLQSRLAKQSCEQRSEQGSSGLAAVVILVRWSA
jgi:hypothetical protein